MSCNRKSHSQRFYGNKHDVCDPRNGVRLPLWLGIMATMTSVSRLHSACMAISIVALTTVNRIHSALWLWKVAAMASVKVSMARKSSQYGQRKSIQNAS